MRVACHPKNLLCFVFIVAGCSSGGTNPPDVRETPDGACGVKTGAPRVPGIVDGYFSNGVLSGYSHAWLKNTTSMSSVTLDCQGDGFCSTSPGLCAHVVLEGSSTFGFAPSFLEPTSLAPQAGFGITVNQGPNRDSTPAAWSPTGDGLYVAFTASHEHWLVVELTTEDPSSPGASEHWCAAPGRNGAIDLTIPWTQFMRCWGTSFEAYSPAHPIKSIDFYVEPAGTATTEFDLCLLDVVPYGLPAQVISCEDWYRYPIPGTPNVLINNVWNAQLAGGFPYKQCLLKRCTPDGDQYGWMWDWPMRDFPEIMASSYAAPEGVFGRKPWDGGTSTTPDMPRRIDALASLDLDYFIEIMAGQTYNLNATMWLTQTDAAPVAADPENVVAEVMVRFNNPVLLGGGNIDDGPVTLGGIPFRTTHQDAHGDASGGSPYTWKMVIYEAQQSRLAGRFDLVLVLRDLLARGQVRPENGVQGVELVTEVSGGQGEVWLNRFGVMVQ
jgi:hypothetical protein